MSADTKDFAEKAAAQTNPGEFDEQDAILENGVLGDDDTNGISASMVRFGDLDNEPYAEEMDKVGNEIDGKD